jgi:HK97 family phage major capsid protein
MKLEEMNLEQVTQRLAELDEEVRNATDVESVNKATEEKKDLLSRKSELEDLETRKQAALDITAQKVAPKVIETRKENKMDFEKMTSAEARGTEEYRNAFLKGLLGQPLNEVEKRINEMATTDALGVVPTITQERIFNKLKEYAPLLSEITLLQVPGNVSFVVEGTNNAAAIHAENTLITPAADATVEVKLGGFEIVKILRISATVQAMGINSFESWLVDVISENISAKIGSYLIYGSGSSMPEGVDYAQTWSDGTTAVQWAAANPTYAELMELAGYLKAGYHRRAKWLMNSTTFWTQVLPASDNSKVKILTDDFKRLLGYPIMIDDNCVTGDIFFGDFKKLVGNLSQNIKVDRSTESGFVYNSIDFRGTAIFDSKIAVGEAFVKGAKALTAGA